MAGKIQNISTTTTRQKVTVGIFALIILILIWQVYKMFLASGSTPAEVPAASVATKPSMTAQGPTVPTAPASPPPNTPQQAQLIKIEAPLTPQDQALLKLQQETQAKYLSAVSELQMLKVARDIAETDQAIMSAKLSSVTAQKKIVELLAPPPPPPSPPPVATPQVNPTQIPISVIQQRTVTDQQQNQTVDYVVVSVAQIQYQWSAVLGAKGVLYNVRVGDVIPLDNSRVIHIDRSGVVIQKKNGARKRLSLVPII